MMTDTIVGEGQRDTSHIISLIRNFGYNAAFVNRYLFILDAELDVRTRASSLLAVRVVSQPGKC